MTDIRVTFAARAGSIGAALFHDACALTLKGERVRAASISFIIVNDRDIARINRKFLRHFGATDVISFPMDEGPPLEAEVYISIDTARSHAREYNVPLREECARLAIHGTLHCCGYDDNDDADRNRMVKRQETYVRRLFGI